MTDTSKPAFPRTGVSDGAVQVQPQSGMTLRQYYAAHAPAERWPFYKPVMPARPTLGPWVSDDGQRKYATAFAAEAEEGDNFHAENQAALDAWLAENERQRFVQWPWFYADAVLAAGAK